LVLFEITGLEKVFMEERKLMATQTEIPVFALFSNGQYALIRIEDYNKELLKKTRRALE
jgi:hypothetical protein